MTQSLKEDAEADSLYFHYMITLKEQVDDLEPSHLIEAIWSTIVASRADIRKNPILMYLITQLASFNCPEGLSDDKLAMLYQISLFTRLMVKKETWPEEFLLFLPQK